MIRRAKLILAAVLLAAGSPALAQQAVPVAPPPARVATARALMDKVLPAGAMQRVMKTMMASMSESMVGAILPADKRAELRARDPAFDERFRRTMDVMSVEMGKIMGGMEPQMKDAMAVAYARRFDERQLADIGTFFATPSGAAYAREALSIPGDPALVQLNMSMMPKLLGAMPDIMKKVQAATADLPPPPKLNTK